MRDYYVYILCNESGTLYTGVTNSLERRVAEHGDKLMPGFTSKSNIGRLVYFEVMPDVRDAIAREKQIKSWRRSKKLALIRELNPLWTDLAAGWYVEPELVAKGSDPSRSSS